MKVTFIITFICLLNSYTHAADFPTGNYLCNTSDVDSNKRTTKISIEEIRVGTMSLPLIQVNVISGDTGGIANRLNGIASIEERNGQQRLFVGRTGISYDSRSKKLFGYPYGLCEQL